jgi:hypothetical protein
VFGALSAQPGDSSAADTCPLGHAVGAGRAHSPFATLARCKHDRARSRETRCLPATHAAPFGVGAEGRVSVVDLEAVELAEHARGQKERKPPRASEAPRFKVGIPGEQVCVLSLRGTPQSLNPSTASANRIRERHRAPLGRLKQPSIGRRALNTATPPGPDLSQNAGRATDAKLEFILMSHRETGGSTHE